MINYVWKDFKEGFYKVYVLCCFYSYFEFGLRLLLLLLLLLLHFYFIFQGCSIMFNYHKFSLLIVVLLSLILLVLLSSFNWYLILFYFTTAPRKIILLNYFWSVFYFFLSWVIRIKAEYWLSSILPVYQSYLVVKTLWGVWGLYCGR